MADIDKIKLEHDDILQERWAILFSLATIPVAVVTLLSTRGVPLLVALLPAAYIAYLIWKLKTKIDEKLKEIRNKIY